MKSSKFKRFEIDLRSRTTTGDLDQKLMVIHESSLKATKESAEQIKQSGGWQFVKVYKLD